jgi:hypothetical protein
LDASSSPSPTSTETLVDELATRLHRIDLVGWAQIAAWAENFQLSFEDLRLLLALKIKDAPSRVSDLAGTSGLSLDAAYSAAHGLRGRGYQNEERREYSFSDEGRKLVAILDGAHREGIQAYVDQLDPGERQRLDAAFGITR